MPRTFAAADIGSNTAHLLIAATDGQLVMRLDNCNEWIPLGEVVAREKHIPNEFIDQLALAVLEFKRMAAQKQSNGLYVFATEGMRMATNHDVVLKRIAKDTGITVELISPRREAELSLRGAMLDTQHLGVGLMFEVGGGSVQIGSVRDGQLEESISLPIGTGKIIAETGVSSPCSERVLEQAVAYVDDRLSQCQINTQGLPYAVISGGVGRGLWRALHPDGDKLLSFHELEYLVWSASRLTVDRITARFGVKTKRAGTLLPGAIVYRALMKRFDLEHVVVSEFGVREGAVLELSDGKITPCPV